MNPQTTNLETQKGFYEGEFHGKVALTENEAFRRELERFVEEYRLRDGKFLEIGSGQGYLQDAVRDYTGIDIVESVRPRYRKPFFVIAPGRPYPFPDAAFDAVFTYATFEHVTDIAHDLGEMVRVLKPGGYVLFHAAWQVRPWARDGYAVRPYRELNWKGRLVKLSIPLRDSLLFRLLYVVPQRVWRTARYLVNRESARSLRYRRIEANYERFWTPDSDACNRIDPHAMILWFRANRFDVLNYPTLLRAFLVRSGSIIARKKTA